METYIVTGFTPSDWNNNGVAWFASLQEFAKTQANVIVVHSGELPPMAVKKLSEYAVTLLPAVGTGDIRLQTWEALRKYAAGGTGTYLYWDGDAYFQSNVDALFDAAADKMVICENLNPGMLGGPVRLWELFLDFYAAADQITPGITSQDVVGAFAVHFPKLMSIQKNTWNFTSLPSLKSIEGQFAYNNEIVKVVHPTGPIKNVPEAKAFFFQEKYALLHTRWSSIMSKGSAPRSFLKRVHHEAV